MTIPVKENDGCIDIFLRADTPEIFEAVALQSSLLIQEGDEMRPALGITIDRIGEVVIVPPIFDGENIITPAVIDDRYHVNIRIREPALSDTDDDGDIKWQVLINTWLQAGQIDTEANNGESAIKLGGVSVVDPATVLSPYRQWL